MQFGLPRVLDNGLKQSPVPRNRKRRAGLFVFVNDELQDAVVYGVLFWFRGRFRRLSFELVQFFGDVVHFLLRVGNFLLFRFD